MPKAKKRKKTAGSLEQGKLAASESRERAVPTKTMRGLVMAKRGQSMQNLVFSAMVGLGCWGLACFFIFFYGEDSNHYLYGGMMAVTAFIWSYIAVRRWSLYRQHV